jgi:hypothetical protein
MVLLIPHIDFANKESEVQKLIADSHPFHHTCFASAVTSDVSLKHK